MNYEKHPINIYPELKKGSDDYKELLESLSNGYDINDPIVLYEGKIIDGWNRYLICKDLDTTPTFRTINKSYLDALIFVKRKNARRNLTPDAKIMLFAQLSLMETEYVAQQEAKKKMSEAKIGKPSNNSKEKLSVGQPHPTLNSNKENESRHATRVKLAKEAGVGQHKAQDAITTLKTKPDLVEKIIAGETTFAEIKKQEKKEKLEKDKEEYNKRVVEKKDSTDRIDIYKTTKKFRIISADPPWSYNDKQNTSNLGGAQKHYSTMTLSDICKMPIKDITEANAVLFLWVTSPLLEESFEVIKAWGFKYKTSFIWDKINHNMGHYNSVRHELLLVCTKGSCTPDTKKLYDSVISIEKTDKHSQKPIEFLNIIDELYNYGERIELFCRESRKDNWYIWGNEV